MLDIATASHSDRGQRAANEDALGEGRTATTCFAVLADGAGGHRNGAEASRLVVDRVVAELGESDFAPERLTLALRSAHAHLGRAQSGAPRARSMQATVVVLWIDSRGDRALISHVGDSRIYRVRYGCVERLTTDDSAVQRLLEGGVLTAEQARDHPLKSHLLAAIGMQGDVEPHTIPTPIALEDGDAFLLCTDGWWGSLADAELAATLGDALTPQDWLDALAQRIVARGTPHQDNFSAIAIWAFDLAERTRPMP